MMGGRCDGGAFVHDVFTQHQWSKCRGCMQLEYVPEHGENRCQSLDGREELMACPELQEHVAFEGIQLYGVNKPPPKRMGWRR